MSYFAEKLREVINCHCRENSSDTPDFILAEYLFRCLDAFDSATRERDKWHKFHPGLKEIEERPLTLGKASNSLQQLKAEIRAISDIVEEYGDSGVAVDFPMLKRKLRELSAV